MGHSAWFTFEDDKLDVLCFCCFLCGNAGK